jgi:hypothetical protein
LLGLLGCGENVVLGEVPGDVAGRGGGKSSNGGVGGSGGGSGGKDATDTPDPQGNLAPECWHAYLPPAPVPLPVEESDFDVACATAGASDPSAWSTFGGKSGDYSDAQPRLVGRWRRCNEDPSRALLLEFGGNRRFRQMEEEGGEPFTVATGLFYILASGQLNVRNVMPGNGVDTRFLSFHESGQAVRWEDGTTYARVEASAQNGFDNPPPLHDGECDVLGTWETTEVEPSTLPFVISFDSAGNFALHDPGANECSPTSRTGTYELDADGFEITSNIGIGLCAWWFGAGFSAVFENDCTRLTLQEIWDNCTGGRGYFGGLTVLEKR